MFNDEVRIALEEYDTSAKAKYKGTRAPNTHEIVIEDDEDPDQDPSDEPPSLPETGFYNESPWNNYSNQYSINKTHIYHISKHSS